MAARRFVLALALLVASANLAADEKTILLWPDGAPNAKGTADADKPSLTIFLPPADKATGTGIIVAPGGGYSVLAIDHEGQQVARWLNSKGIAAFLLTYRLKPNKYAVSDAILDGERAMRYVRSHAKEFSLSPNRIGMLGFSAGAHLSATVGIDFDAGDPASKDPLEMISCKPDFLCLIYGSSLSTDDLKIEKSAKPAATSLTTTFPPAFLFGTAQDGKTSDRALDTAKALRGMGVEVEVHSFGGWGPHGLGMAVGDSGPGAWPELFHTWLQRNGLLTDQPRMAIKGHVNIDGKPLNRGWVTFYPSDSSNKPFAAAYLGHGNKGSFAIDAKFGACAGPCRVEIIEEAIEFGTKPSIENYVKITQSKGAPITFEVKPGENMAEFEILTK